MRKYQIVKKKKGHLSRKDFNKKKEKKKKKKEEKTQKTWENTDSSIDIKDMRFHERSFKLRRMNKNEDSSKEKFNQIEEDEEKKT